MSATTRLKEMGLELPSVVPPVAAYVPAVQTGSLVYTSGQLPMVAGTMGQTGLVGGPVRPVRRAIAQPEAEMVRRDAPVSRAQLADQVAIQERPGGRAVHHDDRGALALVDVAQTTALDVEPQGLERILSTVDPRRNQRCGSFLNASTISGSGVPIGNT